MTIVAPYFYNWSAGSSAYVVDTLTNAQKKIGLKAATSAFIIGDGYGNIWQTGKDSIPDLKSFVSNGGYLIISFGGASGPFLYSSLTTQQYYQAMKSMLEATGCRAIDHDIEGAEIANTGNIDKINKALAMLQKDYPGLYVSYTLAVQSAQYGALPASALSCLKNAVSNGVSVSMVNGMVMDLYGAMPKSWGQTAIDIMESMKMQISSIFTNKSDAQLYGMLGATPMIGRNDDNTIFTLEDAKTLTAWAKQKGLGLLSFWALQRDQKSQSGGLATSSMVTQNDFDFYNIFNTAASGSTPTPAPSPAPAPVPAPSPPPAPSPSPPPPAPVPSPSPSPSSVYPTWTSNTNYKTGDQVIYSGELYQCIIGHVSQSGWEPQSNPSLWKDLGTAPAPGPSPSGSITYPSSVNVQLPTFTSGKTVKSVSMNVYVTFDSKGTPKIQTGNPNVVYS